MLFCFLLVILTIFFFIYTGSRVSEDPEHIELIPNVILNPGYSEDLLWPEGISNEEKNELNEKKKVDVDGADDDDDDGDDFTIYFASRSDATAIKV